MYTLRYAVALSKQRGVKRVATSELSEEEEEEMLGDSEEEDNLMGAPLMAETELFA